MTKNESFAGKWLGTLVASFVIILIICGAVQYQFLDFNNKEMYSSGSDTSSLVTVENDIGSEKVEKWNSEIKVSDGTDSVRRFVGETVNLKITNGYDYPIKNWSIRINPKNECYLNGFWGGSVEIHQFRNGEELVESVDSIVSNSEIKGLEVNTYVDYLMIHLQPGDYFVFNPTIRNDESSIVSGEIVGLVFNFYYIEPLDFSDYTLSYHNDIMVKRTWIYPVLIILWVVWLCALISYLSICYSNRRMKRDLQSSVQAISVMADLYLETYMINPDKQSAYLIKGNKEKSLFDFGEGSLQECVDRYIEEDCKENYREDLKQFLRIDTVEDRLGDSSSIVFEYKSKSIGWCSVRIFKLGKIKSDDQYIIAIQDINEERKKLQQVEENIRQKENEVIIQGDFLDNTFFAMNQLVAVIRGTSEGLAAALPEGEGRSMACSINNSIEHLHLLKNCIYDLFTMDTNRFELKKDAYSIVEMVDKLKGILMPFYLGKAFEFQLDIEPSIPKTLRGDRERIMQILVVLLFSSMFVTEKGFVKLSVFGKQNGNVEELIFSVRDSAMGFTEEQVMEIQEVFKDTNLKPLANASMVYLQIMNQILIRMKSELKLVSVLGSGSEFYFSIEQEVVNE